MSLQFIINNCESIGIDRRKVVGIQYTRNETPRISETPSYNPWRFSVSMPPSIQYSNARGLMEAIDKLDRKTAETVTFSANTKLDWIFKYQGAMSLSERNAITVSSHTGNQLTLGNLPSIGSGAVLFEPNDLIQTSGLNYPYTVVNQVLRGGGSTVVVNTHRGRITTTTGANIVVGNACSFTLFCPNMPTYKLVAGAPVYSGGVLISNALIEWSSEFNLYEIYCCSVWRGSTCSAFYPFTS